MGNRQTISIVSSDDTVIDSGAGLGLVRRYARDHGISGVSGGIVDQKPYVLVKFNGDATCLVKFATLSNAHHFALSLRGKKDYMLRFFPYSVFEVVEKPEKVKKQKVDIGDEWPMATRMKGN